MHTSEHSYWCEGFQTLRVQSDKSFAQNGSLQNHMRIHNGEKTLKSEQCDKSFARRFSFQKHIRIHSDEKLF